MLGFALFISGLSIAIYNIATSYSAYKTIHFKDNILPIFLGFFYTSLFVKIPPILYSFSVSLQKSFTNDLISLLTQHDISLDEITNDLISYLSKMVTSSIAQTFFFSLLILYAIFKVFISSIKRSGTLFAMIGVGSLYTFSISYSGLDSFLKWAKQIVALCVTGFLQSSLLILGLMTFTIHPLIGIGLLLSAGEVNKVAGQFGLDVSAKDSFNTLKQTSMDIIRAGKMLAIL